MARFLLHSTGMEQQEIRSSFARNSLCAAALVALIAACGGGNSDKATYTTHGTERAPGADAEIVVTPLDSGNFKVTIDTEHMPPPERLAGDASHYVVWIDAPSEEPKRLGYLPLNGSRSAEMYGTTVAKSFEIQVTAESSPEPASPAGKIVLRQSANVP